MALPGSKSERVQDNYPHLEKAIVEFSFRLCAESYQMERSEILFRLQECSRRVLKRRTMEKSSFVWNEIVTTGVVRGRFIELFDWDQEGHRTFQYVHILASSGEVSASCSDNILIEISSLRQIQML